MTESAPAHGNVLPFRQRHYPQSALGKALDGLMADALQSFDLTEEYASALQSLPLSIAGVSDDTELPIVAFQGQLPIIEQRLDQLGRINVATWLDIRWVFRVHDARSTAGLRLRAVMRSLRNDPPGPGPLNGQLAVDVSKFADALRKLRQVIAQQFPSQSVHLSGIESE